jgi:xylose isomerase
VQCEIPRNDAQLRPHRSHRSFRLPGTKSFTEGSSTSPSHSDLTRFQLESNIGAIIGGYEFASRQTRWSHSSRCLSMCETYVIDRMALEEKLPAGLVRLMRNSAQSVKFVMDCFNRKETKRIAAADPKIKIAAQYIVQRQQERADASRVGGRALAK